jgi:adenylate kinase family enzyme
MANEIAQALGQSAQTTGGRQGFRPGSGTGYQAARIAKPVIDNSLGEAMRNFIKAGGDTFASYEQNRKSQADERSNEIIRKLTPEQRRQAIEEGTLLYADDPDAMQQLRLKSGRNAAYEVDNEVQTEIQKGTFRTRKELDEWRQTRMEQKAKNYAEMAGIDPNDSMYQQGFNSDITQRNAAVYDLHSQYLSKNLETQAVLETQADLQPMLDDPKILGNPASAEHFASYFNNNLKTGVFPSDGHAVQALQRVASAAVEKDGGVTLLDNLGDKTINVYGGQRKVSDLLGPEMMDNLKMKAATSTYTRNSKRNEEFELGLANAVHQADPAAGWQALNKLEQANDWIQTGEQMTPQRQKLIDAKKQMIAKVAQDSQAGLLKLQQAAQADNRQVVIDDAYTRRMSQENVAVSPKFLPVNANTGEFKESDMATYAANKLSQINAMSIPEESKSAMKAALLRADYDKGPFQENFKTLLTDASREWQGALLNPEPTEDMPRLKELQAAYQQDPSTIAQLFPDQAGLLEKLRYSAESGIDPQILIDAEKSKKGLSKDESKFRDEQWSSVKNDSGYKELKFIPGQFESQARQVFDAVTLRSGDSNEAASAVSEYLKKTAVSFTDDKGTFSSNSFHGMVSKRDLMTDVNDVTSWETGKSIIDETMQNLRKDADWGAGGLTVTATQGNIIIQSLTGRRLRISKDALGNLARDRAAQQKQAAFDKNVKSAQKDQELHDRYILGGARKQ